MNISTRGRYGLRALLDVASVSKKGPVTIKDISKRQQMSVTYLEQIFHKLKNAGILKSVRGARGGYILAKDQEKITVREIIDVLDGPIYFSHCDQPELREKSCTGPENCVSRLLWKKLEEKIEKMLSSVTLADLERQRKEIGHRRTRRRR